MNSFDKNCIRIEYDGEAGSGIIIPAFDNSKIYIVTAHHVLKDTEEGNLDISKISFFRTIDGIYQELELTINDYKCDSKADIAVIQADYIDGLPHIYLSSAYDKEELFFIGYPYLLYNDEEEKNKRLSLNLISGEKRSAYSVLGKITDNLSNYYNSEIEHLKGFSGGGIVTCDADCMYLIGIETSGLNKYGHYNAIEYISADYIYDFICKSFCLTSPEKILKKKSSTLRKIKPYLDSKGHIKFISDLRLEKTPEELELEYKSGVNAHPDHIRNNLDIRRDRLISEIYKELDQKRVVIIRGASGQGKTTAAYRYLLDKYEEDQVICIRNLRNSSQINDIIYIIKNMYEPENFIFYLDVNPGNSEWIYLCDEFINQNAKTKLLITIREEDYNRNVNDPILLSDCGIVNLSFSVEEAHTLYDIYRPDHFRTFDESWELYGEKGPLMEYIYTLNHSETLKSRIKSQIKQLVSEGNENWLEAIAIISLAGKYGNAINQDYLFSSLNIDNKLKMIDRFIKEFFIRDINNDYIESLHAVRAEIIINVLLEERYIDYKDILLKTLSLIEDNALYMLVEFFAVTRVDEALLETISKIEFRNSKIYSDVLWAYVWLEVNSYIEVNKEVINEGNKASNNTFCFTAICDITNLLNTKTDPLDTIRIFNPAMSETLRKIIEKMPNRYLTYKYVDLFFDCSKDNLLLLINEKKYDGSSLGFVLFWLSCRKKYIPEERINNPDYFFKDDDNLDDSLNLFYGIYCQQWHDIANTIKTNLLNRVFDEFNVVYYEEKNNEVYAYILPMYGNEDDYPNTNSILVNLVGIFKMLNPDALRFNVKIIGMDFIGLQLPDLEKHIPTENMYCSWLTKVNNIFLSIDGYTNAIKDWNVLLDNLIESRRIITDFLNEVKKAITFFYKYSYVKNIDKLKEYERVFNNRFVKAQFELPQCARDSFGLNIRGDQKTHRAFGDNKKTKQEELFPKVFKEYFDSITAFANNYASFLLERKNDSLTSKSNIAFYNIMRAFDILRNFQNQFNEYFKAFNFNYDDKYESKAVEQIAELCNYMYYNKYRIIPKIEAFSHADAVKRENAIKNFFYSEYKDIPGIISGEFKEKSLFLNVDFEKFQVFYDGLYNQITNLTDNITTNTLESAYLKRIVSKIIINIINDNQVIIKDFTIDITNFILYSKDKDKFDAVVRVGADATRNEDVNSFVQAYALLYSSIQSVNQIFSIIKCVVFDLKDVPKEFIIKKILNSFNEMFMASLDEIRANLFKAFFYKSEHELSDIEDGIVNELEDIKKQFQNIMLLKEEYVDDHDYTFNLSNLINEWAINETENNS